MAYSDILVWAFGIVVALLVGFVGWLASNPLNYWRFVKGLYKGLSYLHLRWERRRVALEITVPIDEYFSQIPEDLKEIFPRKRIRIKWVQEQTREAFIRGDEIVLVLQHHTNEARNFLNASMTLIPLGFLEKTKEYLEPVASKALELVVLRDLLIAKRPDALPIYRDEIISKERAANPRFEETFLLFSKLQDSGYLIPIYSRELGELAARVYPATASPEISAEISQLTDFMEAIANRAPGENIPTTLTTSHLSLAVMMVARKWTLFERGHMPYLNYVGDCKKNGLRRIYVLARKGGNIGAAKSLSEEIQRIRLYTKERVIEYQARTDPPTPAVVIVMNQIG